MKHFKKLSLSLIVVLTLITFFSSVAMAESVYIVKTGDALWKIADKYGLAWKQVSEYNN